MKDFIEILKEFFQELPSRIGKLSNKQLLLYLACAVGAVVLALILILVACQPHDKPSGPIISSSSSSSSRPAKPSASEPEKFVVEAPEQLDKIEKAFNKNKDVVGWLHIPDLKDMDNCVVKDPDDKYTYEYRTESGEYDYSSYWVTGAYFTHLRNTFGKRDALSRNTVIFGHSDLDSTTKKYTDDNPDAPRFSQLFNFLDPAFAKKHPYIFFSTPEEDMIFEIFAVYYNDSGLGYIDPEPSDKNFQTVLDKALARSQYTYDTKIGMDDKILTLSTCTVHFGYNLKDQYRFVVMAKLIDSKDATKKEAVFVPNEKIDPAFKG